MIARHRHITEYASRMDEIRGWFHPVDLQMMDLVDRAQAEAGLGGDILEIGCYEGKSAVLLGWFLRGDEKLFVCDPFDTDEAQGDDRAEISALYAGVSSSAFLRNFARFHDFRPTVLACPSSDPALRALPRSFRFVHVDGSHRYENVRRDIELTAQLLVPGGIAVFDDYRYWVEVSFAVWRATALGHLRPIAVTEHKLYGSFEPSAPLVAAIQSAVLDDPRLAATTHTLEGFEVVVVDSGPGFTPPS